MSKALKFTKEKQEMFLELYRKSGIISQCARAIGISYSTIDNYINERKEASIGFRAKFLDAKKEASGVLEMEAYRRGVLGRDEPIFYKGEKIGDLKKYSDTLLIVLLKGAMPEKYKENYNVNVGLDKESISSLARMLEEANGKTSFIDGEIVNEIEDKT